MTLTLTPDTTQRWTEGRSTFRTRARDFAPRDFEVAPIAQAPARAFVEAHHYARSFPQAQDRLGLFRHGTLVGVAVFGRGTNDRTLTNVFAAPVGALRELSRLVLLDEVPFNAESWFVARCFAHLRRAGVRGVVSMSDPMPRTTAAGLELMPGHVGTVYQALNAAYLDRSDVGRLLLLPDATAFSRRTLQKIRSGERGWTGPKGTGALVAWGADPIDAGADRAARLAWLRRWIPALCRPMRHPGNHRYAWTFGAPLRMAARAPYPKRQEIAA